MTKNLILGLIVACSSQIWTPNLFFRILSLLLDIVTSYDLGQTFSCLGPNVVYKFSYMGFTSTRCYALLLTIIVCNFKEN